MSIPTFVLGYVLFRCLGGINDSLTLELSFVYDSNLFSRALLVEAGVRLMNAQKALSPAYHHCGRSIK